MTYASLNFIREKKVVEDSLGLVISKCIRDLFDYNILILIKQLLQFYMDVRFILHYFCLFGF